MTSNDNAQWTMRALFAITALFSACGEYSVEQPWTESTCIRVPAGTPGYITLALIGAHAAWSPLPAEVVVTNRASCKNTVRVVTGSEQVTGRVVLGRTDVVVGIDGNVWRKEIQISDKVPDCQLQAVVNHEFGHFLGLGEDHPVALGAGVMAPVVEDCIGSADAPFGVTAADRAWLREVYD